MSLCKESLFQIAFNLASTAEFIVEADTPHFTIAASNEQHKIITGNKGNNLVGKSIWEVFNFTHLDGNGAATLMRGLEEAILIRETVRLPSFQYPSAGGLSPDMEREWWQVEITPFLNAENTVTNLMCTTHNITGHVTIQQALERVRRQEQALQREVTLNE
jgi:hypothetical protein